MFPAAHHITPSGFKIPLFRIWILDSLEGPLIRAAATRACHLIEGRTAQAVSKPCIILNKACRGVQMYAHKASFFSGLYKAHSVCPDSIHPDYLGFETA